MGRGSIQFWFDTNHYMGTKEAHPGICIRTGRFHWGVLFCYNVLNLLGRNTNVEKKLVIEYTDMLGIFIKLIMTKINTVLTSVWTSSFRC